MQRIVQDFYTSIGNDPRIGVSHISLYFAILYRCADGDCFAPFFVTRGDLMQLSKIKSRQTYNCCMNELKEYGYIGYTPSSDPATGSMIAILRLRERK
jgi:hypothetical protein